MSKTIIVDNDSFKIDYSSEKLEDEVFKEIKTFCTTYLFDYNCAEKVSDNELFAMYTFVSVKFDDVKNLKKSLDIKEYSWSFIDSSKIVDDITLSESIYSITERPNLFLLTKELNYLYDILSMCYGVIKKICLKRENLKKYLI